MADDLGRFLGDLDSWDLLWAVLTVLAGWLVSRTAARGARALLQRLRGLTPAVVALSARLVKYLIMVLAIGIALGFLGAPVQPVLAAALIAAVVVVLALRGISENFAAGVVLQTRLPIRIGDEIGSDGHRGVVTEMNGRSVVLTTADGQIVHLPNTGVLQRPLTNYSVGGANRAEVEVRMLVPADQRHHWRLQVQSAAEAAAGVNPGRPVHVLTVLEAPDRTTVRIRFWHRPLGAAATRSAVVTAVSGVLEVGGVTATVTSDLPAPAFTPPAAV